MKMKKALRAAILPLFLVFVLAGCSLIFSDNSNNLNSPSTGGGLNIERKITDQSKIKKFEDYSEFEEFLSSKISGGANQAYYGKGARMEDFAMPSAGLSKQAEVAPESSSGAGASNDFSRTNIQVEGVDEADIIKTDGQYIYAVVGNNLFIIKARPASGAEILAKIEFKDRPQDLYVSGDRLAIFGSNNSICRYDVCRTFRRHSAYSFLKIFDIADRKNPRQIRDLDFEGSYSSSRLIKNKIYFITNNYGYYYVAGEPIVPRLLENGEVLPVKCDKGGKCFAPPVYYFDIPYDSYNLTLVSVVDIKDPEAKVEGEIYTLPGAQNFYVSENNLYIAYTKYVSQEELETIASLEVIKPLLPEKDQKKIDEISAVKDYILSESERLAKIRAIIERYVFSLTEEEQKKIAEKAKEAIKKKYQDIAKELEKTVIHKIAIEGGHLKYKTFGEATGTVLNQFSMDESGGYFRLATTKNRSWVNPEYLPEKEAQESYSNVYVLNEDMKIVGSVEKLAPEERIYSARFMGDRAYLVTFKQTDPLFAIDLSNPKNPRVLGQLKIPGFSNYLHPYDNNTLIGIGKETEEKDGGRVITKGLKIALFDVSDVSNPKEIDKEIIGGTGSDSVALSDHKAVLFSRDKNLLVIPAVLRQGNGDFFWGKLTFSGALIFKIEKTGLEERGRVDHSDGLEADRDYWNGYEYYDNSVLRSLYIDDTLYTFSNNYLKMNKLGDLEEIKSLRLKKEKGQGDDFVIIN